MNRQARLNRARQEIAKVQKRHAVAISAQGADDSYISAFDTAYGKSHYDAQVLHYEKSDDSLCNILANIGSTITKQ